MTNIHFDFRRGAGSAPEILYGKVELKPTLAHVRATAVVLPAPTTIDLVDGEGLATNVSPTPEPVGGVIEWALRVKVTDRHGKSFEWMVGVPDTTTTVEFANLPRYFETRPPAYGVGPAGPSGEAATVAVGTVSEGTEAAVTNSGTNTDAVLNFVLPEGPQGPKGGGTFFKDSLFSDPPSSYSAGITFGTSSTANGWPESFVLVTTEKRYAGRTVQRLVDINNNYIKQRTELGGAQANTWGPLKTVAWDTLATISANGLMSSADKSKLDGILAGSSSATPNTTVIRDSTGSTALNSLTLSTVPDDPASATNKEYVDGRVLNTPYLYGAIGDGVADDTGAITEWLDSANPNKHLDRGTFKINGVTTAQSNINVIGVGGKLLGAITNSIMLSFTGNNVRVEGIEVDGNNIARGGVYFSGDRPILKDCSVHNTYTTNSLAYGVCLQNLTQGYSVIGNHIYNIRSVGNDTQGDSNGASRAIYVTTANSTVTGVTVRRGQISQNIISDIDGEEGDAIQVIIMPNYGSAKVDIANNTFNGFSRRGIKLQAGDCTVQGNKLYSDAITGNYANVIGGIDSQYASNNSIIDNDIELKGFTQGIGTIGGTDTSNRKSKIIIKGNTVRGGSIALRFIDQGIIQGNVVYTSGTWPLYVQGSPAASVLSNTVHFEGALEGRSAIFIGFNSERSVIRDNSIMSGSYEFIVNVNSPSCVVKNNDSVSLSGGNYQGNGTASTGTLYADNSSQSTSSAFTGYSSSQRHRGFDGTRASSYIPNFFFSTTDPTNNGRYHSKGDVYFDFSSQAVSGGYVGWICTEAGSPGTFARWGTIV